jgi:hypothetical protein
VQLLEWGDSYDIFCATIPNADATWDASCQCTQTPKPITNSECSLNDRIPQFTELKAIHEPLLYACCMCSAAELRLCFISYNMLLFHEKVEDLLMPQLQ